MFFLLNVKIIKNALKLNTLSFILYKIGEKIIRVGKMATKDISSEKNTKTTAKAAVSKTAPANAKTVSTAKAASTKSTIAKATVGLRIFIPSMYLFSLGLFLFSCLKFSIEFFVVFWINLSNEQPNKMLAAVDKILL